MRDSCELLRKRNALRRAPNIRQEVSRWKIRRKGWGTSCEGSRGLVARTLDERGATKERSFIHRDAIRENDNLFIWRSLPRSDVTSSFERGDSANGWQ